MSQVLAGVDAIKVGDLRPTRDLTFVTDTATALALLADANVHDGSVVNIGTGIEYSMGDIVDKIQELAGTSIPLLAEPVRMRPPESEVFRLLADNSRLKELTHFTPTTPLEEGLTQTMEWLAERLASEPNPVDTFAI